MIEQYDLEQIKRDNPLEKFVLASSGNSNWNGRSNVFCPFHAHHFQTPSMSVRRDIQMFKCFVCDKKGSLFHWVGYSEFGDAYNPRSEHFKRVLEILTGKDPHHHPPKIEITHLPPPQAAPKHIEYHDVYGWTDLLWYYKDDRIEQLRQWLYQRGVTKEWGFRFHLGYTGDDPKLEWHERHKISIPWKVNSEIVGIRLRSLPGQDSDFKYSSIPGSRFQGLLFNQDCRFNASQDRVLQETELDAVATCAYVDDNCSVACSASGFTWVHAMTLLGKRNFIMNDNDPAGEKQDKRILSVMPSTIIVKPPANGKDNGDAFKLGTSIPVLDMIKQNRVKALKRKSHARSISQ